jgi:ribosome-interacting GTPase 1
VSVDFLDKLAREQHTEVMSCELDLGISDVVDRVWKELRLIRIYTKRYALRSLKEGTEKIFCSD